MQFSRFCAVAAIAIARLCTLNEVLPKSQERISIQNAREDATAVPNIIVYTTPPRNGMMIGAGTFAQAPCPAEFLHKSQAEG